MTRRIKKTMVNDSIYGHYIDNDDDDDDNDDNMVTQ